MGLPRRHLAQVDGKEMTDLVWTPIKIKIGQVVPWQDNPRMSTKVQANRLIKSEKELGQIQTLAVSPFTDDGRVYLYDGHQRCAAWLTVKDPSFEVNALQSNRMLTDDERRKVSVLLHTATGSWNWESLSSWSVADLREWGMDADTLKGWNTDAENLKELLNTEQEEQANTSNEIIPEQYAIMITCKTEQEQTEMLERFLEEGITCRALMS